jgi:hypothetical protein
LFANVEPTQDAITLNWRYIPEDIQATYQFRNNLPRSFTVRTLTVTLTFWAQTRSLTFNTLPYSATLRANFCTVADGTFRPVGTFRTIAVTLTFTTETSTFTLCAFSTSFTYGTFRVFAITIEANTRPSTFYAIARSATLRTDFLTVADGTFPLRTFRALTIPTTFRTLTKISFTRIAFSRIITFRALT